MIYKGLCVRPDNPGGLCTGVVLNFRFFGAGDKKGRFKPAQGFPGIAQEEPAWYATGKFDGKVVALDKDNLLNQLDTPFNEPLVICPLFDRQRVIERIKDLPGKLDPVQGNRWATGYFIENNKPAWVFPKNIRRLPFGITLELRQERAQQTTLLSVFPTTGVQNIQGAFGFAAPLISAATSCNIPVTRYADLCGQNKALELVRDYAELPLLHPELFQQVRCKTGAGHFIMRPSWERQDHARPCCSRRIGSAHRDCLWA